MNYTRLPRHDQRRQLPKSEGEPMSLKQRRALDQQLRAYTPLFDANRSLDERRASIPEVRNGFAAIMATMRVPDGFRATPAELAGLRALRFDPVTTPRTGTILFFHGGSYVAGSPETHLGLTGELVVRTGRTAYSVDYRLAPEHPFPAAIDDTTAAYRALLDAGNDPATVVFAGDSAGGGLAVTTALNARRLGLPMPGGVVAFSPGLDNAGTGASAITREAADPILSRESVQPNRDLYRADADPAQELLSPADFADMTGFPPLLLQVGTNEILLDDVPHVFQTYTGLLDEADRALERAALFIDQRLR
jgi:monoterpene epsilon-lactone hydrolase